MTQHLPTRAQALRCVGVAVGAAALLSLTTALSRADDGDPRVILKARSDYVASQKTCALTYDTDIEVITLDLQKGQFTASGTFAYGATAGVAAGPAIPGVDAYPPGGCVQVVNADGQVITRCR
jgi:hypothetical protein